MKRFRKTVRAAGKVFLRQGRVLVSLLGTLFVTFALLIRAMALTGEQNGILVLQEALRFSFIYLTVFSLVSYEAGRLVTENDAEEVLAAASGELFRWSLAICVHLVRILLLASAGAVLLICVSPGVYGSHSRAVYAHAASCVLLYYTCPGLIGILLGAVLQRRKRTTAYAALFLAAVITSPILTGLFESVGSGARTPAFVLDWISLGAPDAGWAGDRVYGVGIETYRWALAAFWILLLTLVFVWRVRPLPGARRRVLYWIMIVLILLCGVRVVMRHGDSVLLKGMRADSIVVREVLHRYDPREREVPLMTRADPFEVEHYSLELTVKDRLSGTAKVELAGTTPKHCGFTLYRGYELKSVTDGKGQPLPWSRYEDWIDVQTADDTGIVILRYEGTGDKHIANRQGIELPGSFAYYPVPGHHDVWDRENCCYTDHVPEAWTDFSVRVHWGGTVISNLTETGEKNCFEGRARAVTLMGGLLKETETDDGVRVVGSVVKDPHQLQWTREKIERLWERYCLVFGDGEPLGLDTQRVFYMPETLRCTNSREASVVFLGDHLLVDPSSGMESVPLEKLMSRIPERPEAQALSRCLRYYLATCFVHEKLPVRKVERPAREELETMLAYASLREAQEAGRDGAWFSEQEALIRLFLWHVLEDGETETLRAVYDYLRNGPSGNAAEFLFGWEP